MNPLTLDTGALIAIERNRQRMVTMFKYARVSGREVLVPAVCVAEWWRGRTDLRQDLLDAVRVVHTDDALVKTAGEAIGAVRGAGCIDALVMAVAARHDGIVFTSDVGDLSRLQAFFPAVRVLGV